MKKVILYFLLLVFCLPVFSGTPADTSDFGKIRNEIMNNSEVMENLVYMCDVLGPRLMWSSGFSKSADWIASKLKEYGIEKVYREDIGKSGINWTLKNFHATVKEPFTMLITGVPKEWTPGTNGTVTSEVIYLDVKTDADFEKYKGKLKGKIIMLSPYTTTPVLTCRANNFFWGTTITDNNLRYLHSDIAFFRNTEDSLIVSFSNIRDSSKVFFAKTDYTLTVAVTAGGPIGGTEPTRHKQFGVLASNQNNNGLIVFFYRMNESPWNVRYMRTTNYGNFNSMLNSTALGSTYNTNYAPNAIGVRGTITSYMAFTTDASADSIQLLKMSPTGTFMSRRMNALGTVSANVSPRPGFRNVNNDSCFVIYNSTGPFSVWAAYGCSGTLVNVENTETPDKFGLQQNYPNPFNPSTSIRFDIPKNGHVNLAVYDILGREVAVIVNDVKTAGSYQVDFNAEGLTNGVYFYRLTSGQFSKIKKLILLK